MKYYEVNFSISPFLEAYSDVLSASLAEIGFESFAPKDNGLSAYIQQSVFDEKQLEAAIGEFPIDDIRITFEVTEAEYEDWNAVWEEEGFHPIVIDDTIVIHDVKHKDVPALPYDIIISPKLAFGTGSHQTTRMILRELSGMDLKDRKVIDAGTGTGILSIMCIMRGAQHVFAYDIDEWSVENTKDNLLLNGIHNQITIEEGDASVLSKTEEADLLIANINRNILQNDLPTFSDKLKANGQLLISGFYTEDVPFLLKAAQKEGLSLMKKESDENWCMLLLKKG
jgi:ribosomal protein L11 methyltransferase